MSPEASFQQIPWWILLELGVSFLVGWWLFVSTMMMRGMGLDTLLELYPPVDEPVEQSFHGASGTLHKVSLSQGLYVGLGSRGVHLAPDSFFGCPFYRDIPCIPWSELECVRAQGHAVIRWFRVSRFKVPALGLRFSLRGEAGLAIERKLLALSAGRP